MNKLVIVTTHCIDTSINVFTIGGVQTYMRDLYNLAIENNKEAIIVEMTSIDAIDQRNIEGHNVCLFPYKKRLLKSIYQPTFDEIYKEFNNEGVVFVICTDTLNIKCSASNVIQIQHGITFDIPGDMIGGIWGRYRFLQRINKLIRCNNNVNRLYHTKKTVCVDYNYYNWFRTLSTIYPGYTINVIPNYSGGCITQDELNRKLSKSEGVIRIIFARRFVEHRGTLLYADAAERLLRKYDKIELTFAGDGPQLSQVKERFKTWGNVTFITFTAPESIKIHQKHDIAVVPTIFSEGTSLSVCEAMASGCIPVSTYVGGLSNLILSGYNGLMVPPTSRDIEVAIESIINMDSNKRELMIRRAYDTATTAFSRERWGKQWIEVLEKI